jgi:hypothetical protein
MFGPVPSVLRKSEPLFLEAEGTPVPDSILGVVDKAPT